jgi:hypothetical protein
MNEPPPSIPRSTPTVSLPRGRSPQAPPPAAAPSDAEVIVLSGADILWSGPLSSSRGAARAQPAALSASPALPADPLIGKVLADRYRILELIGRGGMGSVYKVQHTRIGKLLAMKILSGETSQGPEVARRFRREAQAVSKLASPNTVQVFDFGVCDGLTYLAMELVDGDNLGRVLREQGPMPVVRLGRIVVQVCNALAEAHEKGIVHRDIKPENVMLVAGAGGADVAKVLDFGLAKLRELEGTDDETCQGIILGTPAYMAPEQIEGLRVDARTDVYSLGALMYRLVTGHPPFHAPSPMAVLSKHLHERPVPPAERAPELGIPLGVSRLVMRALRKDPADRFQRVEDLQALLVEELRLAGAASMESLLDPERLRWIARPAAPAAAAAAAATRDEVDAYERQLRRRRYGLSGAAAGVALAAAAAGLLVPREARPGVVEIEPNDTPAEATPLALGQPMTGQIGRRLDPTHGDRDFYAFDLVAKTGAPGAAGEGRVLRLRVSALPNIALCTMLYRPGFADPVGQYCVGRPGRDLVVPALSLPPGRYLLAVVQDMDGHGGPPPYVHESISDTYTVVAESVPAEPAAEIEPNDHLASATRVEPDQPCAASLGWVRDEDFFCVPEGTPGRLRWSVRAFPRDPGARDPGALEATAIQGGEADAPARVALADRGPWQSAPVPDDGRRRCLRVRLAAGSGGAGAEGGDEPYTVEAESLADPGPARHVGRLSARGPR